MELAGKKILNCPLCGSEDVHIEHEDYKLKLTTSSNKAVKEYEQYTGRVICDSCGCTMPNDGVYASLDDCIEDLAKSWNERSAMLTHRDKIKPCPFCGSKSVTIRSVPICLFLATCEKCGASSAVSSSRGEALELWNKRYDNRTLSNDD